jgi:sterol desaturase/sphingolipid hydroxylase (fatty acid hydroxylase superfamily)
MNVTMPRGVGQLLAWQPREPSPRWEPWLRVLYAVFAIGFSLTVVVGAVAHQTVTLGLGLVDEPEGAFAQLLAQLPFASPASLAATVGLATFVLAWNGVMVYRGFAPELPRRQMLSFLLLNVTIAMLFYLALGLIGLASAASGRGFSFGVTLVRHFTEWSQAVVARVPTVVRLPYPLPLVASVLLVDLFQYWFHRLGHTWRPFWLLWHRPHHMPAFLTIPTTQPVFAAFPLFLLLSVPFQVGIGVAAKLFSPDSMITEALLVRLVGQVVLVGSHNTALYSTFFDNRLLRALGAFFGDGPYHYLHHSTLPGHSLVNLGGPFFMVWDRIFGTYVAPTATRPPVGLPGSPRLHGNPLRLGLAGLLQLAYEWGRNPGWRTRLAILFGSASFVPPRSKDFALE